MRGRGVAAWRFHVRTLSFAVLLAVGPGAGVAEGLEWVRDDGRPVAARLVSRLGQGVVVESAPDEAVVWRSPLVRRVQGTACGQGIFLTQVDGVSEAAPRLPVEWCGDLVPPVGGRPFERVRLRLGDGRLVATASGVYSLPAGAWAAQGLEILEREWRWSLFTGSSGRGNVREPADLGRPSETLEWALQGGARAEGAAAQGAGAPRVKVFPRGDIRVGVVPTEPSCMVWSDLSVVEVRCPQGVSLTDPVGLLLFPEPGESVLGVDGRWLVRVQGLRVLQAAGRATSPAVGVVLTVALALGSVGIVALLAVRFLRSRRQRRVRASSAPSNNAEAVTSHGEAVALAAGAAAVLAGPEAPGSRERTASPSGGRAPEDGGVPADHAPSDPIAATSLAVRRLESVIDRLEEVARSLAAVADRFDAARARPAATDPPEGDRVGGTPPPDPAIAALNLPPGRISAEAPENSLERDVARRVVWLESRDCLEALQRLAGGDGFVTAVGVLNRLLDLSSGMRAAVGTGRGECRQVAHWCEIEGEAARALAQGRLLHRLGGLTPRTEEVRRWARGLAPAEVEAVKALLPGTGSSFGHARTEMGSEVLLRPVRERLRDGLLVSLIRLHQEVFEAFDREATKEEEAAVESIRARGPGREESKATIDTLARELGVEYEEVKPHEPWGKLYRFVGENTDRNAPEVLWPDWLGDRQAPEGVPELAVARVLRPLLKGPEGSRCGDLKVLLVRTGVSGGSQ